MENYGGGGGAIYTRQQPTCYTAYNDGILVLYIPHIFDKTALTSRVQHHPTKDWLQFSKSLFFKDCMPTNIAKFTKVYSMYRGGGSLKFIITK